MKSLANIAISFTLQSNHDTTSRFTTFFRSLGRSPRRQTGNTEKMMVPKIRVFYTPAAMSAGRMRSEERRGMMERRVFMRFGGNEGQNCGIRAWGLGSRNYAASGRGHG